jgi:ubiquinone/menaquinone biosynthesis C-methylase UbiE
LRACAASSTVDRAAEWRLAALWPFDRLLLDRWRKRLWHGVPDGRILEVGVGAGASFPYYSRASSVVAIDKNPEMLRIAERRARDNSVPVRLLQMDVEELPFADSTFDVVVGSLVFGSVNDPMKGLKEIYRVCRPGGEVRLLEHVRSETFLGRLMDWLNPPFRAWFGSNLNQQTVRCLLQAGWMPRPVENLLLDVVQIVHAVRPVHGPYLG